MTAATSPACARCGVPFVVGDAGERCAPCARVLAVGAAWGAPLRPIPVALRFTPWGEADDAHEHASGVYFVYTPSHGGFLVTREAAARMPAALRALGEPWGKFLAFEEDAAYGAVVLAWPAWFPPATVEAARAGMRTFYPSHVDGGAGCGRETDRGSFHRCPR